MNVSSDLLIRLDNSKPHKDGIYIAGAVDLQLLWAGYLAALCNLVSILYRRAADALLALLPCAVDDKQLIPEPFNTLSLVMAATGGARFRDSIPKANSSLLPTPGSLERIARKRTYTPPQCILLPAGVRILMQLDYGLFPCAIWPEGELFSARVPSG